MGALTAGNLTTRSPRPSSAGATFGHSRASRRTRSRVRANLHRQWASVAPFGSGRHTDFTSMRIAILAAEQQRRGRTTILALQFQRHNLRTSWDPLRRAYFNGYALWTYLTTPFLLGHGRSKKSNPRHEGAETWRGLRATFPAEIASHSSEQEFYFGEDMLIRRHATVDIAVVASRARVTSSEPWTHLELPPGAKPICAPAT